MALLRSIANLFRCEQRPDAEYYFDVYLKLQRVIMADIQELKSDVADALESVQDLVEGFKQVVSVVEEQKTLIVELKAKIEQGTVSPEDLDELDSQVDQIVAIAKGALPADEAPVEGEADTDEPA
ncbi:hypothetical protein EP7_004350 [Isosphaeraceae bacterium EP7]